jgi:transmembrane sensor
MIDMDKKEIAQLLLKYADGTCSKVEKALLEDWYMQFRPEDKNDLQESQIERYLASIRKELPLADLTTAAKIRPWPRIISVAAAIALIVFGVWFFSASRHPELVSGSPNYANDIAPGKNTATLTLANGKTIELSDAKTGIVVGSDLRYSDGTEVTRFSPSGGDGEARGGSDNSKNRLITATTPRGGTYQVILPDGSKVWLNAASSIIFPSTFSKLRTRKVELIGEAYFEVFKNKKQPFVVISKKMELTVLGTHFNVNAYEDENSTKATLLEGSVRVSRFSPSGGDGRRPEGEDNENRILKPNQQAYITNNSGITVKEVDVSSIVDWKNGEFAFSSETLEGLMRKVQRWYDVEVIYEDSNLAQIKFSGTISRFENVSKLLNVLQTTRKVQFRIEGKKIIVTKYQ